MPSVSALWGRHWQRWGLKHTAGVEKPSRTGNRLRGMTGKGNVSEALVLRIVTPAELKRLSGSRPQMGRGAGLGEVNGHPTHVESPPVSRGPLPPGCGYTLRTVGSPLRSRPVLLTESPKRKGGEGRSGYRTREEAKARR